MEIYDRIRYLRKDKLRLTQEKFGEKLGVSRSVINNIERNVLAKPEQKEPLMRLICTTFNVNEDWLRFGSGGDDNIFIPDDMKYLFNTDKLAVAPEDFKECIIEAALNLPDEYWELLYNEFKKILDRKQQEK